MMIFLWSATGAKTLYLPGWAARHAAGRPQHPAACTASPTQACCALPHLQVCRLAMLTLLAVFRDLIPAYRIRPNQEEESLDKASAACCLAPLPPPAPVGTCPACSCPARLLAAATHSGRWAAGGRQSHAECDIGGGWVEAKQQHLGRAPPPSSPLVLPSCVIPCSCQRRCGRCGRTRRPCWTPITSI